MQEPEPARAGLPHPVVEHGRGTNIQRYSSLEPGRSTRAPVLPVGAVWCILLPMYACHSCGKPIDNPREVYRSTACSGCGKDLKVCLNCRFYSPGAHWDCAESIDEQVTDKERANFCTFFVFRDAAPAKNDSRATDARGSARNSAEANTARSADARRKLDKLFGNEP